MENREDDEQERLLNNQIKEVQDAARVAKKAASGNWLGAAKDALKSDAFKKKLKKTLIKWAIQALIWLVIIGAIVGIVTTVVDNMISLFASIGTNVNGFFTEIWQQLTDDYWTNIGEREDGDDTEFIIDTKEGRIVAYYKIVKKGGSGVSDNKELIFHKEDLKDLLEEKQRAGEYVGKTVYDLDENELWMLTEEYLDRLGREHLITQKYTLIDAYLRDLGDQGISIKDLRLLGNADYSDEKKLLEDPENKALVEKYMSEFIRADIITQQIHKRDHIGVVNGEEPDDGDDDNNQNEVDGGLYLYRSKSHEDIDINDILEKMTEDSTNTRNGEYEYMPICKIHDQKEDKDEDYTRMIYVDKEEFDAGLQIATNQDTFYAIHKGNQRIDIRDVYTLDKETGDVLVAEITASYDIERDDLNPQAGWFKEKPNSAEKSKSSISNLDITATPYIVQYREYVAKYAMTYEFLINLCQVTQNPEFVYHVALLARDTDVSLIILDTEHVEKTVKETLYDHYYYENYEGSYIPPGAISHTQDKGRYTHVEFELHPEMKVKYANAWTYYEAFSFTRHLDGEIEERTPPETTKDPKNRLENKGTKTFIDENNNQVSVDYWYDTLTDTESHIRDMVLDVTYEEVPIISQEKSKQFLGLVRNGSGECKHDCYKDPDPENNPEALKCSQEAVFKRSGTNVAYTIPGTTEKEMAYNKLTGGIELLYAALQNNTTGYSASDKVLGKQYDKDEDTMQDVIEDPEDSEEIAQKSTSYAAQHDYGSSYVVKLEPIVEHLKYLMTLPENEYISELKTLNGLLPNYNGGADDDSEIYIPDGNIPWKIWCALISAGYSEEAAAGVLGNIEAESQFITGAINKNGASGLAQWLDGRKTGLMNYAASKGVDWKDADTQIEYLIAEITGSGQCFATPQLMPAYQSGYDKWVNASTPEEAADGFLVWFERPGFTTSAIRQKNARYWYDLFSGKDTTKNLTEDLTIPPGSLQEQLLYVLNHLSNYSGITNAKGRCQEFVREVFQKIGIFPTQSAGSATAASNLWGQSTDATNIPIGATVYGRKGSNGNGHVGIYIGGGKVVHNIGKNNNCYYGGKKGIKCDDLTYWKDRYDFKCWGWQAGVPLQ